MVASSHAYSQAEQRVQVDPLDLSAWEVILSVADQSPLAEGRPLYERFLEHFPCAAVQWKRLVDSELRARDFASAEGHLAVCLRACPHLGLWETYISFVKLTAAARDEGAEGATSRLVEAYALLLDTVGLDVGALPHWLDYIALLKAQARAEPRLVVAVRRAYQRALALPLARLEALWQEYEAWELMVNRTLGRQLVAEWADRHRAARKLGRERASLRAAALSDPPGAPPARTAHDAELVAGWRAYLAFEAAHAAKLPPAERRARLVLAHEQSLLPLRRHAHAYTDAALALARAGDDAAAVAYLQRGAATLAPRGGGAELLALAEAALEERRGQLPAAEAALRRMLERSPLELVWTYAIRLARRARGARAARSLFAQARAQGVGWRVYAAAAELEYAGARERASGLARACNIWEAAAARGHLRELEYTLAAASFLRGAGEGARLRAHWERALGALDAERAEERGEAARARRLVWHRYLEDERAFGSAASLASLEQRRAAAGLEPAGAGADAARGAAGAAGAAEAGGVDEEVLTAERLATRFRLGPEWPCSAAELELLGVRVDAAADGADTDTALDGGGGADGGAAAGADGGGAPGLGGGLPPPAGGKSALGGGGAAERRGRPPRSASPTRNGAEARRPLAAGGGAAAGTGSADARGAPPLTEAEALSLAHALGAPEPLVALLSALPPPCEFYAQTPSEEEVGSLLEMLVSLPPDLHQRMATAARLFAGPADGAHRTARADAQPCAADASTAARRAPSPAPADTPAPPADSSVAAAAAVKPEALAAPPAPQAAAVPPPPPQPAADPEEVDGGDDDDDDDDALPLAKRTKMKGAGSNLYSQRLQKAQAGRRPQ